MLSSRTVSISIARPVADVYDYLAAPENVPLWSGFITAMQPAPEGDAWIATTSAGVSRIRFVPRNAHGIVDHTVTVAPGVNVFVPMRVVANQAGSQVLFTIFRQPTQNERQFTEDVAMVEADLAQLKRVLES